MAKVIAVYDGHTRKRLAYLQNAYNISYTKNTASLWTGAFSLPYTDPKTKYCKSFNLIELWDEDAGGKARYVGLFRIMPQTEETLGTEANIEYQLEHVLSVLLDDLMVGYHEVGNTGVFTAESINYILSKQSEQRWVLKECDYEHQFLYGWQNENLLSALLSIVQPFEETDYYWDFDTQNFPWGLSLKKTVKEPVADIRYKKNLNGLTRIVDPTNLTTRLYCYGYGDGDNVLGISDVNNGKPYIDSPNISKYGVITQTWTDERFTVADSLLAVGQAMLKRLEEPGVSYELDIQTIYSAGNLNIGDVVRVVSVGLDELMTVTTISKDDVTGAPQSGKIELGQGTIDISTSLAELADRQRIAENYSQGAESIFTDSFADNADPENPANITFLIPDNVVHVNEIAFTCVLSNFRAYSKAVKGGGGGDQTTEDGGSEVATTTDGGSNTITSEGGGEVTRSSSSGGGGTYSSSGGGGVSRSSGGGGYYSEITDMGYTLPRNSDPDALHNHGMNNGPLVSNVEGRWNDDGVLTGFTLDREYFVASGAHYHEINIPSHSHSIDIPDHDHYVYLSNHSHDIYLPSHTHGIDIPAHTHNVTIPAHHHDFVLPNHTHGIEYGIYKGPTASKMDVYLDDTKVGTFDSSISGINLIEYMSKNANGKVMRGAHTIKVVPDQLTRVECIFQIRLFTNMHGGQQY